MVNKKEKQEEIMKPMDPQVALNELCKHLLGEDWHIIDPLSQEQVNMHIVHDIELKYKRVKKKDGKNSINKIQEHEKICDELNKMYETKNTDYGDSVGQLYDKLGDITLLTRITDKYNRLLNMFSDPKKQLNHESIDDSIEDMANYCIIWAMERRLRK